MSGSRDEQDRLLKQHGCVLARDRKHEVWRLPDGRMYTRAKTPSDFRANDNSLRVLRTMLGINGERGKEGERRDRRRKNGRTIFTAALERGDGPRDFRDQLAVIQIAPKTEPRYRECFPLRRQSVLRTVVSVWMARLTGSWWAGL